MKVSLSPLRVAGLAESASTVAVAAPSHYQGGYGRLRRAMAQGSSYDPAAMNCVVLITSQDKKPIQATLQSNAMHKIKVADLSIRPRFGE